MYRPCYYDVKHGLVIKKKHLNQECYPLASFDGLVYFRTEIEALICRELLGLQKTLISRECDYQVAIKKRVSFEYLPPFKNYSGKIYRFAFGLEFYHIADIWKRMECNAWGIKRKSNDSPWDAKFKKLFLETLNDIATESTSKNLVVETFFVDYMKNSEERPDQSFCFHASLLNESLSARLINKCVIVINKQLAWYDVPFQTADLSSLHKAVFDSFMTSINPDNF